MKERGIQRRIVNVLRARYPDWVFFHVPNGGARNVAEAAGLKDDGVLSGVYDLIGIGPYPLVVFIEVKAPTGRTSKEQEVFAMALERLGHRNHGIATRGRDAVQIVEAAIRGAENGNLSGVVGNDAT